MSDMPPVPDTDTLLVGRVQRGDARAFEMLVVRYQRRIERLISRLVGHRLRDPEQVRDVAQETFLRAWRALPRFRGESAFYTWLYRIAVNTARQALDRVQREPLVDAPSMPGEASEEIFRTEGTFSVQAEPSTQETPEAVLASRQVAAAVSRAVDALSEDLRQALVLREVEGLSYEEIAEVMNCPVGTVRSRIYRARESVAQQLRPVLDVGPGRRW